MDVISVCSGSKTKQISKIMDVQSQYFSNDGAVAKYMWGVVPHEYTPSLGKFFSL